MRLPIKVASALRARKLIEPGARVLVALSGGPDSVALLLCLVELARKRDLRLTLVAAHLNHRLRGRSAERDQAFCRKLCAKLNVELCEARCQTLRLAQHLKRSKEETARLARRAFLAHAARVKDCRYVAVAHHADDRIETVLFRLCRGTGFSGLEGIGWTGPLTLAGVPAVDTWIEWLRKGKVVHEPLLPPGVASGEPEGVVRPLLGCTRAEVLDYLTLKRQRFCTDETNFDTRIPRNALRRLVLPALEKKVHPGVRSALWRLAEEAQVLAERRAWRRGWLDGVAALESRGFLALPVPQAGGPPAQEELADMVRLVRAVWRTQDSEVSSRHLHALRTLFGRSESNKRLSLSGGIVAERRKHEVWIRKGK